MPLRPGEATSYIFNKTKATKPGRPNATPRGGTGKRTNARKPAGRRLRGRRADGARANYGRTLTLRRGRTAGRGGRAGLGDGGGASGPADYFVGKEDEGSRGPTGGEVIKRAWVGGPGAGGRRQTAAAAPGRPEMGRDVADGRLGWRLLKLALRLLMELPCNFLE